MHKPKIHQLLTLMLTIVLLTSLFSIPLQAETASGARRTVRVGLRSGEVVNDSSVENSSILFDKQYLQAIAEYASWDYTYVYGTWSELQEMAKNGEVDILMDVSKTDARQEYLDFSETDMGTEICNLIARSDTDLYYNDFTGFNGMTIGYEAGSTMILSLESYAAKMGFTYTGVEYPDGLSLFSALDTGEVDAVVQTNYLDIPDGHVILAKCSTLPVYIATSKKTPELITELNQAMTQLTSYEPNFNNLLYKKIFKSSSAQVSGYTKQEAEYLAANPVVYVAYETDWKPFEYQNNGEAAGITPDVIRAIGEQTGIQFKFIESSSTKAIYDQLGNMDSDVVMAVSYDYLWANQHNLQVTQPYVSGSIMRVTRNSTVTPESVAIAGSGYLASEIQQTYPDLTTLTYDNFDQCIKAVAEGKADCTFINYYQANYYRALSDYSTFIYQPVDTITQSIALGVTNDSNPILLSILSKALQRMSDSDLQSILSEDTVITEPASLHKFIKNYPVQASIVVTAFMILIAILLFIAQGSKERNRHNLALAQAKQEADNANKAKSEFLANMSHDIRTPLNAIVGMTNMAVNHLDNPKQAAEDLNIVTASSKHLLSLVNDVLDLSKIESGKIVLAENSFIFPDLINEVETMAWPLIKAKDQEFTISANTVNYEFLIGDKERLKQILVNFISNATKYTPVGGKINLDFKELNTDDPKIITLVMSCSDTGIGIAKENQEKIFEPFSREIRSTINPVEGTGLGLAIVKRIVTAMKGTIELVSEKGKGSTFTVKVPIQIDDQEKMIAQFSDVMDYETLFIADTEETCQFIHEHYLVINRKPCDVASNAQILQDTAVLKENYDSILIISANDAPQVIARLHERFPASVIIYGCDMKTVDMTEQVLDAGADAVLYRPVFRSTLFEEYRAIRLKKSETTGRDRYLLNKHVLVAEDQPINYAVAEYMLKEAGAQVMKAENGREAVDSFLASKPGSIDLIMMDIMMPEMNGYEAARAIRASNHPDAKSVIIVAMTANAFAEDIQKSLESGMNGHISKPIEASVVKDTLIKILSSRKKN